MHRTVSCLCAPLALLAAGAASAHAGHPVVAGAADAAHLHLPGALGIGLSGLAALGLAVAAALAVARRYRAGSASARPAHLRVRGRGR